MDNKLLIDLTPDESGILSFITSWKDVKDVRLISLHLLNLTSNRAKMIGYIILGEKRSINKKYNFMAQRFIKAHTKNTELFKELYGNNV